jgi:hypothetical protein
MSVPRSGNSACSTPRTDFWCSQPHHRLVEERPLLARPLLWVVGQAAVGVAEGRQHLAGVPRVEQIDNGGVVPLHQVEFQPGQEARHRQPEVVAHQQQRLHAHAVALP